MIKPLASGIPAYTLFTMKANRSQRRFAFIVGAVVAIISLLAAPLANLRLPMSASYQPALLSTVICFELITVFVLYSQFRVSRAPSILVLAAGYLYSALMTLVYMLTFPGIVSRWGLFHAGHQTAEYLYALWHAGFPIAMLLHMALEKKDKQVQLSVRQMRTLTAAAFGTVILLVCLFTNITTAYERRLPIVMDKGHITPLFLFGFCLPILLLSLAALIGYYRMTRGSTVTASWLCVALLATMLDVGIVMCGGGRFSLGWYMSKLDTFIFANIVLAGMIYEFTKMYVKLTELYGQVTESEGKYKSLFTQSRLAEQKIAKQNNIIERMLESSHEAIVMCDSEGKAVLANGRFEQLFGRQLPIGSSLSAYCEGMKVPYGTLSERINAYFKQRPHQPFRERVSLDLAEGETRHYECFASPIASEDGDMLHGHLFTFGDRTDEERKANYDELTGLPNRRYTHERIQLVLDRAQQTGTACSIFFMDLDGFKKVNDTLGHEMGDRLLQEVAVILRGCVGNQGISARWAGDEFVVLIENADDSTELEDTARAIIRTIRQLDVIDGRRVSVSASIGIAVYPEDGTEGTALLQRADQAMYEAKARGKNNYCFSSGTHESWIV